MSIVESPTAAAIADPVTRRWTRDEYYQLYDAGHFQGQRVQLIHGEIYQMSPMRTTHAVAVELADRALSAMFGESFWIRNQLPLYVSDRSEPEPDIAVVRGGPRDYLAEHPRTALLVVEISDSTLPFDRSVKRRLYASADVAEYWIVNLVDRQLEVFRQPTDGDYRQVTTNSEKDEVIPLASDKHIPVAELLP